MAINSTRKLGSVKVDIRLGQASPAQKHVWRKFWQKLLAEVKRDHYGTDNA